MKKTLPHLVERGRHIRGLMRSEPNSGPDGHFTIKGPKGDLFVIASNGMNWDHVSVSVAKDKNKIPSWKEMCFVKDLFWEEDECVIQYHPPKSEYINIHKSVLHLWSPQMQVIPTPPLEMV